MMEKRSEIVLNRLFSGDFLENNIGHEFINLCKADDGQAYLYIQPYGTYSANHFGKIRYVFMVRIMEGQKGVEVIALAEVGEDIFDPRLTESQQEKQQAKFKSILYGGYSLRDLFAANQYQNTAHENVEDQCVYTTMRAKSVLLPNKRVRILFDRKGQQGIKIDSERQLIEVFMVGPQAKTSLKQYFTEGPDFESLQELAQLPQLWTEEVKLMGNAQEWTIEHENFFDICGVADYELAFSNAFGYFMQKYPELFVKFAKEVLHKEMDLNFTVERETYNVDILVKSPNHFVVIENKVTSKINGIKVVDKDHTTTQLEKYYKYAVEQTKGTGQKMSCYVLTPDYNQIDLRDYDDDRFTCSDKYQEVLYSQVYEFLLKQKSYLDKDVYFAEFVRGLQKHARAYHNDLFADLKQKLAHQIQKIRK